MRPIRLPSVGCKIFDDRRSRRRPILHHQDVDFIAIERTPRPRFYKLVFAVLAFGDEHSDVLDEIGADRLDVLDDARNVGKPRLRFLDLLIDRIFRCFAIELAHLVTPLLLPLRDLQNDMFEILFQDFDDALNLVALGLRPSAEFLRRNDLAVLGRSKRKAERRAQDDDVFFGGLVAQRGEGFALLLLKGIVDRRSPRLVILALKDGRQRALEVVDQFVHRVVKRASAPGGQLDGDRPVRIHKVVDIDPIGRTWACPRLLGQHGPDGLLHVSAVGPDHE